MSSFLFQSLSWWYSWLTRKHLTSSPKFTSLKTFFRGKNVTFRAFFVSLSCQSFCQISLSVSTDEVSYISRWLCLLNRWGSLNKSKANATAACATLILMYFLFQWPHYHQCGSWRLWWRLSDGCPCYFVRQIQDKCLDFLGKQPDIRYDIICHNECWEWLGSITHF